MEQNNNQESKYSLGFEAGWRQLKLADTNEMKVQIMAILGVTTNVSFCSYRNGNRIPRADIAERIENAFAKLGVTEIWGK